MDTGTKPNGLSPLPAVVVGAILLAEGYASLAAEILALRRMVPFAGSAVSVTAVLLAVYLAALAAGYRRDGRLARRGNPRPRLAIRLAAASAWSAFWLSGAGTLLAECVLVAHACAPGGDPSRTAGDVFALSTIGNVARDRR